MKKVISYLSYVLKWLKTCDFLINQWFQILKSHDKTHLYSGCGSKILFEAYFIFVKFDTLQNQLLQQIIKFDNKYFYREKLKSRIEICINAELNEKAIFLNLSKQLPPILFLSKPDLAAVCNFLISLVLRIWPSFKPTIPQQRALVQSTPMDLGYKWIY